MSKMSHAYMELSEAAAELGFESLEDAEANGYGVFYNGEGWDLKPDTEKQLELAHEAWLKDKGIVLGDLTNLLTHKVFDFDIIERAIKFIKECHD